MGELPNESPHEPHGAPPVLDYASPSRPLERLPLDRDECSFSGRDVRSGCLAAAITIIIVVAIGTTWMNAIYGPAGSATRVRCASHLRQIGQCCSLYANDHGGIYPHRVEDLLSADLAAFCLVCPGSDDTPAVGDTNAAVAAELSKPGHCSYIYLGAGLTTAAPAHTPVACDRLKNHDGKGIHVLYADGSITWLDRKQAESFLARLPPTAQHPATRSSSR